MPSLVDLLFEQAGVGLCLLAPGDVVVRANAEWQRYSGRRAGELQGRHLFDLCLELEDLRRAFRQREQAGPGPVQKATTIPSHQREVDDRSVWWEGNLSPVWTSDGPAVLVTIREAAGGQGAAVQDAPEIRLLLQRSEGPEADDLGVTYFLMDAELRYTSIICSQPEQVRPMLGRTDEEIFGPEEGAAAMKRKREVMRTGLAVRDEISVHWAGKRQWIRHILDPLRDSEGRVTGISGAVVNVTSSKRTEAERELALVRLQAVIEQMPAAVYIADESGGCALTNRKTAQLFDEDAGRGLKVADFLRRWRPCHLDGTPISFDEWPLVRSLRNGETVDREELVYRRGGSPIFLSVSSIPLRDRRGRIEGAVGMAWDVTEQKSAEQKLRETTTLLEATNHHKDEFVAMLAHELRNPLAAMSGAVHLIRRAGTSGGCLGRYLAVLERQIRNSSRLLDDLLDVSRMARHRVRLQKEVVRLDAVIGGAVDAQQSLVERTGHQLQVSLPDEPVLLDADPTRLEQIVSNLLNNAAKYTPDGGQIDLRVEREGSGVVIRVKDNGIGLPPELVPRIFDPFVQADQPLARDKGGLGLGLTLVRKLTEMHGGSVEARSPGLGKGSEFIVRLPALEGPSPAPQAAVPASVHRPHRVLVVEDNADAAELMAEHLTLLGHTVTVAHDGPSGLAAARRVRPEIAFLDIGLPGLDGYEVARRLRGPDAPVLVAVSGYGQEEYQSRAREAGFNQHLTKPVDPNLLERLIDEVPASSG